MESVKKGTEIMKKIYLKPITKRTEVVEEQSLMEVSLTVHTQSEEEEVDKIEDLLGNSVNVWEE